MLTGVDGLDIAKKTTGFQWVSLRIGNEETAGCFLGIGCGAMPGL
jgi:hypothetical protein